MTIGRDDPGVVWLLDSAEPAIRLRTLTDVLGLPVNHPAVVEAIAAFLTGDIVRGLVADRSQDVYTKWSGAFWRLTTLIELGAPPGVPAVETCLRQVLNWLEGMRQRGYPLRVAGRTRAHALWHGHALAAAVALDWSGQPLVRQLVDELIAWQWADGGWNCDRRPAASCGSVHESLGPLWGLAAYHRATGDRAAAEAARRAAEFFLDRRLFRSRRSGEVIDSKWLRLRYPAYWHYDVLHALWVLTRAGYLPDPRATDALALVAECRRKDGRWDANGRWWKPGSSGLYAEAVDWGTSRPSPMITLEALTVLAAAR